MVFRNYFQQISRKFVTITADIASNTYQKPSRSRIQLETARKTIGICSAAISISELGLLASKFLPERGEFFRGFVHTDGHSRSIQRY